MLESSQKKFFIIFVIVVAAFVGYWIFDALYSKSISSPRSVDGAATDQSPFFGSALTGGQGSIISSSPVSNLTQDVITDLSKDLIASLQDASSTSKEDLLAQLQRSGGGAVTSQTLNTYATPEKLGLVQDIPDSEISIHTDTSISALAAYKDAYTNAIQPLARLVTGADVQAALNAFIQNNDTEDLDNLIKTYDTIYASLRAVSVPRSVVLFHKDTLKFFANEKIVFLGIRGYKDDPLRAYLLGEQLEPLSVMWQNIYTHYQTL